MTTRYVSADAVFADDAPMTLGLALKALRECEEMSQAAFGRKLGISAQNLCDIEKERTSVSPTRAARWAKVLGYHEQYFVQLALQKSVELARLKTKYRVLLTAHAKGKKRPHGPAIKSRPRKTKKAKKSA